MANSNSDLNKEDRSVDRDTSLHMASEWFLRSDNGIKIFFRLDENFIAMKSPGQSDDEAETLSVENARKRWKALLEEGYSQIKSSDDEEGANNQLDPAPLDPAPRAYWGENTVGIPLEVPEWTYRKNDSNSSSYDSDDYEANQLY